MYERNESAQQEVSWALDRLAQVHFALEASKSYLEGGSLGLGELQRLAVEMARLEEERCLLEALLRERASAQEA